MDWRGLLPWRRPTAKAEALAPAGATVASERAPTPPDLSDFERLSAASSIMDLQDLAATLVAEGDAEGTLYGLPWEVLLFMGLDPVIYLGEQAATAPVKDPELYFVDHRDPAIKAETEAWLRPLLPAALCAIARSFVFGSMPYVLDWKVGDLAVTLASDAAQPSDLILRDRVHYVALHELCPAEARLELDAATRENLAALVIGGKRYGPDRAFVSVWDREFGKWNGKGSRARSHKWWRRSIRIDRWEARYLERSVDSPRIGYAPRGDVEIDGVRVKATKVLAAALLALKNGGVASLPSEFVGDKRQWDVSVLNLPDRSEVWTRAANRFDAMKLFASLAPPSIVGISETTFASGRVTDRLYVELVQSIARFVACELTAIVRASHRIVYGDSVRAPEVRAGDLPQSKQKLYLDVFGRIVDVERRIADGRRVTMGEQVKDTLLDLLKIPRVPAEAVARAPDDPRRRLGSGSGKEREPSSEREERREAAREPEGESSSGAPEDSIA